MSVLVRFDEVKFLASCRFC